MAKLNPLDSAQPTITRFAPSPTGHLHLGHVLHLIWLFDTAKNIGANVLFRMEDHDQSRCRSEFEESIRLDIEWLLPALDPNGQVSVTPWVPKQSHRRDRYNEIYSSIKNSSADLIYACRCTRHEISRQIGQSSGELYYPGTCRDLNIPFDSPNTCIRLKMPSIHFETADLRHGMIKQNPASGGGDIVIRDKAGNWTYQFCVVIDDLDQAVNLIVRGDDLLPSIGRQLALRQLLNDCKAIEPQRLLPVKFLHHPLLLDGSAHKLSKRLGSECIHQRRLQGESAEQIVARAKAEANYE